MIERIQNWDKNSYPPKASEVVEHDEFKALPPAGKIDTLNKLQAQWADVSSVDNKEDYPGIMRDMETWFGDQRKAIVKDGLAEDLAAGKLTQQQVQAYVTQGPDALDDAGRQHFMGRYGDPEALEGPWKTQKLPITGADGKQVGYQYIRRRSGLNGQSIAKNMGVPEESWNQAGYVQYNADPSNESPSLAWQNPDEPDNIEVAWTVQGNDGQEYSGVENVSAGEEFAKLADSQRSMAFYQGMGDPGMAGPSRELSAKAELPDIVGSEGLPAALAAEAVSERLRKRPEIAGKIGQGFWEGLPGEALKGFLTYGAAARYGPFALMGDKDALKEYEKAQDMLETDIEGQSKLGFRGDMSDKVLKGISAELPGMAFSMGASAGAAVVRKAIQTGARAAAAGLTLRGMTPAAAESIITSGGTRVGAQSGAQFAAQRAGQTTLNEGLAAGIARGVLTKITDKKSLIGKLIGTADLESKLVKNISDRVLTSVSFLPSAMRSGLDNMSTTLDAAEDLRKQGKTKEADALEESAMKNGWAGVFIELGSEAMWLNELMVTKAGRSFGDVATDVLGKKIGAGKLAQVTELFKRAVIGGGQGGTEETFAGVGNRAWMNGFAAQNKDIFEGVPEEFLTGMVMEGAMGGIKAARDIAPDKAAMATEMLYRSVLGDQEAKAFMADVRARAEAQAAAPQATPTTPSSAPPPAPGADATLQTSPVPPAPVEPAGTGPSPELSIASGAESAELMTPDEFDGHPLAQQKYVEEMGKLDAAGVSPPPREFMLKAATAVAHKEQISGAINENKPVSAEAVDSYGIKLPDGYKRQGNLYVPTAPVEAPKAFAPVAPLPESKSADEVAKTLHDARSEAIDVANKASSVPGAEVTAEALASIAADEEVSFLDAEAARSGLAKIGEQPDVTEPAVRPDKEMAPYPSLSDSEISALPEEKAILRKSMLELVLADVTEARKKLPPSKANWTERHFDISSKLNERYQSATNALQDMERVSGTKSKPATAEPPQRQGGATTTTIPAVGTGEAKQPVTQPPATNAREVAFKKAISEAESTISSLFSEGQSGITDAIARLRGEAGSKGVTLEDVASIADSVMEEWNAPKSKRDALRKRMIAIENEYYDSEEPISPDGNIATPSTETPALPLAETAQEPAIAPAAESAATPEEAIAEPTTETGRQVKEAFAGMASAATEGARRRVAELIDKGPYILENKAAGDAALANPDYRAERLPDGRVRITDVVNPDTGTWHKAAKAPARDATKPEQMSPEQWESLHDEFDAAKKAVSAARKKYQFSEPQYEERPNGKGGTYTAAVQPEEVADAEARFGTARRNLISAYGIEASYNRDATGNKLTDAESKAEVYALQREKTVGNRKSIIKTALQKALPVSAAAVDAYGIALPSGYEKQGELYVFIGNKSEAKPAENNENPSAVTESTWETATARTPELDKAANTAFKKATSEIQKSKIEQNKIRPSSTGFSDIQKQVYDRYQKKINAAQKVIDETKRYSALNVESSPSKESTPGTIPVTLHSVSGKSSTEMTGEQIQSALRDNKFLESALKSLIDCLK